MRPAWKQPTSLKLAERLAELNSRLPEVMPQLIDLQLEAARRMAETVITAHGKPVEVENHE